MNTGSERMLREAFEQLATAEPVPAGLAANAVRRAERRHTVRLVTTAAAAVLVTAMVSSIVIVNTVARGGDRAPDTPAGQATTGSTATPPSGEVAGRPRVLEAYSFPDSGKGAATMLLNRATGRYEQVPYASVVPSPDHRLALVLEYRNNPYTWRNGILDRATGSVRWIDYPSNGAPDGSPSAWSADGSTVLLTVTAKDGSGGILSVDVATLKPTFLKVDGVVPANGKGTLWSGVHRGANGELLSLLTKCWACDAAEAPADRYVIQYFDQSGRKLRALPVTGLEPGTRLGRFAVAPDGRHAVAEVIVDGSSNDVRNQRPALIVDTTTAAVTGTIAPATGELSQLAAWYDDTHPAILSAPPRSVNGADPAPRLRVVDMAGREVKSLPITETHSISRLSITASDGLHGAAADRAF